MYNFSIWVILMAVILVRSNIFNERDWETEEVLTHRKCANVLKVNTRNVRTFDRLDIWTFGQPCTVLTWWVEDPKCRQCSQWWPSVVQSPTLAVIPWKMFLSLSFIETLPNVCSVVYAQPGVKKSVKWTSDNQLLLRRSSSGQWSPWRGHCHCGGPWGSDTS